MRSITGHRMWTSGRRALAALAMAACGLALAGPAARAGNENPRPYGWTKTAEEILDSIKRYCQ